MTGVEAQKQVKVGGIIRMEYDRLFMRFYRREPGTVGGRPAFVEVKIRDGQFVKVGRKTSLVADCEFKMVTA
jgi:hypothetical protein